MELKKDNGKTIIELSESEVKLKGTFKNKIIKRDNILSARLIEDMSGIKGISILTKDYKIIEKRRVNLKWQDREKLKAVIDEINSSSIIFNSRNQNDISGDINIILAINYAVIVVFGNVINGPFIKYVIGAVYLIMLAVLIAITLNADKFRGILYDYELKKFYIVSGKGSITKSFDFEDIEFVKKYKYDTFKCRLKNDNTKFYFYNNSAVYPVKYKMISDEIRLKIIKS